MRNKSNEAGILKDYFGIDSKTLLVFFGLIIGVVVLVTLIYVAIFGVDNWQTSMSQAGSMMLANFDTNPQAGVSPQPINPVVPAPAAAATNLGAQFNCPTCGSVGLPIWNANGAPICPSCGALMAITAGQPNNQGTARVPAQPAVWP